MFTRRRSPGLRARLERITDALEQLVLGDEVREASEPGPDGEAAGAMPQRLGASGENGERIRRGLGEALDMIAARQASH